jgi:toxin CptA
MAGGEDMAASLRAFRVVGEQVVWLHLSTAGHGRYSLLMAPDNSDADIRRRLRMRLASASNDIGSSPGTPAAERGPTV